jgi:hypothetical protein
MKDKIEIGDMDNDCTDCKFSQFMPLDEAYYCNKKSVILDCIDACDEFESDDLLCERTIENDKLKINPPKEITLVIHQKEKLKKYIKELEIEVNSQAEDLVNMHKVAVSLQRSRQSCYEEIERQKVIIEYLEGKVNFNLRSNNE